MSEKRKRKKDFLILFRVELVKNHYITKKMNRYRTKIVYFSSESEQKNNIIYK